MKFPSRKQIVDRAMQTYKAELGDDIYEDYPKKEVREIFDDRAHRAMEFLELLSREQSFAVYRAVESKPENIDFQKIGIYWSVLPEKAHAYWGKTKAKKNVVVIEAVVPSRYVDWVMTGALMAMHDSKEIEVRLTPGAPLLVSTLNGKPVPYSVSASRRVQGFVLGKA